LYVIWLSIFKSDSQGGTYGRQQRQSRTWHGKQPRWRPRQRRACTFYLYKKGNSVLNLLKAAKMTVIKI